MKKYFFTIILLFLCHVSISISAQNNENPQPFAPVGAKWYYGIQYSFFENEYGYQTIEVIDNTTIDGKLCSVLKSGSTYYYLYQEQQKVYCWNDYSQSFYLLYDFSANVGDLITTRWSDNDYFVSEVTQVETVTISGVQLKRLHLHTVDGLAYSFGSTVTERIGGDGSLFPFGFAWDDMNIPSFRCYDDSDISLHLMRCDFVSGVNDINNNQLNLIVGNEFVQLPIKVEKADLFNSSGQLVISTKPDFENKISISALHSGIYLIKVNSSDYNYLTFKFIKR